MNRILLTILLSTLTIIINAQNLQPFQADNEKWGYKDENGKIVIQPTYDNAYKFREGLAAVYLDEQNGYIDQTGKFVIKTDFSYIGGFSEGLAAVRTEDFKLGFIDKTGKVVIQPFYNGFFSVDLLTELVDEDGEEVEEEYDTVWMFSNGLANVIKFNGESGVIDKKGNFYKSESQARKAMAKMEREN